MGKSLKRLAKRRDVLIFLFVLSIFILILVTLKVLRRGWTWYAVKTSKRNYDINSSRAVQQQKELLRSNDKPFDELSTRRLKELVDVWHNGVADTFTSYGSLIPGVSPDAKQAKIAYDELLRRGESDVHSSYAKLLEFGVPHDDSVVDKTKALGLYQKHYENMTDPYEKYNALGAVERLAPPAMEFQISALKNDIAGQMAAAARNNNRLTAGPPGMRNRRRVARTRVEDDDAWIRELPLDAFRVNHGPAMTTIAGPVVGGDRQNVHDSTVTKTVNASLERLRNTNNSHRTNTSTTLSEVRNLIQGADISVDKRNNANMALNTIERNDQLSSATGMTETQLLNLVWNRLHHQDNADNQQALRENLVDELSACVENGGTVCSTGRFTHILGTLNGVDDIVDIKPGWAISKELVDKAGVMFSERMSALPEEDRAAVNALEPSQEQQEKNNEFVKNVQDDLRNEFKRSYVDAGILTQEGLDVELNKWISDIG